MNDFYVSWWDKVIEDSGIKISCQSSKILYDIVSPTGEKGYIAFIKMLKHIKRQHENIGAVPDLFGYLKCPEDYFNEEELLLLKKMKPFPNQRYTSWMNLTLGSVEESLELLKICGKYNLSLKELKRIKIISYELNNGRMSRIISNKLLEVDNE